MEGEREGGERERLKEKKQADDIHIKKENMEWKEERTRDGCR